MMTLSDVLERHYGTPTRVVGAAACFFYSAPIMAMAGMTTLMTFLGMPLYTSLAVAIGVCAVYTILGGLWADAISDTVQFVLMCVTLALVIPLALEWVGGWSFVDTLKEGDDSADFFEAHGGLSYWMLFAWAMTGLTVLVEPAFYQRVFAAKDDRSIKRALLVGILLWAAYDWGVVLIGMIAQAAVQQGLQGAPEELEGGAALLTVCVELLPTGLRGLFLGGILAAAMSTIDSYSLLASGNIVYDVYRPLADPKASDRRLILLTRLGVFVVMIAAALISLFFDRLRDTWLFMTSVITSVVLVPMMGALFFRPTRRAGLFAAMFGFAGLIAFYTLLFTLGVYDEGEETYVWRLAGGSIELWQDCAALCALPISLIGYWLGNLFGDVDGEA